MPPIKLNPLSALENSTTRTVTFIWTCKASGCIEFAKADTYRHILCGMDYSKLPEPDGWIPLVEVEF
jgi:hypothetical protein